MGPPARIACARAREAFDSDRPETAVLGEVGGGVLRVGDALLHRGTSRGEGDTMPVWCGGRQARKASLWKSPLALRGESRVVPPNRSHPSHVSAGPPEGDSSCDRDRAIGRMVRGRRDVLARGSGDRGDTYWRRRADGRSDPRFLTRGQSGHPSHALGGVCGRHLANVEWHDAGGPSTESSHPKGIGLRVADGGHWRTPRARAPISSGFSARTRGPGSRTSFFRERRSGGSRDRRVPCDAGRDSLPRWGQHIDPHPAGDPRNAAKLPGDHAGQLESLEHPGQVRLFDAQRL